VISIFGNHDYGDYYSWPSKEAKEKNLVMLEGIHSQLGWNLLRNKNVLIGEEGNQLAIHRRRQLEQRGKVSAVR